MKHTDPRVDAYIAKAADFAQPILKKLRKAIHAGCPDVQETLKWGAPGFMHHGLLCLMAAFKEHCTFGFWKHVLLTKQFPEMRESEDGMGQFGPIRSVKALPAERKLVLIVKAAAALNEAGVSVPRKKKPPRAEPPTPPDLSAALRKNKQARTTFEKFSPSCRRDYVEWITEAKQPATRERRLATAIEWMSQGKDRHWKYRKK